LYWRNKIISNYQNRFGGSSKLKYKGNYGCSGCTLSDCHVCRDLKKCPNCGQGEYPIGKHNKCTVCEYQLDEVTYDAKKEEDHAGHPSFVMERNWWNIQDVHIVLLNFLTMKN